MKFGARELILLGVLLAVPLASYLLVFMPQNRAINGARKEIEHRREVLGRHMAETSRARSLEEQNAALAIRIGELERRLPSDRELDRVIREVSDLAVRSGLSAPGMTPDRPLDAAMYRELPIKVTTRGSFRSFVQFLERLENMERLVRVPDLKLEAPRREGEDMTIQFTLSVFFTEQIPGEKGDA